MNILKFVTILCTSYIVVSGAQEFQHSGDPRSFLRSSQREDILYFYNNDTIKRNRRQNWEPTLNLTNFESLLLNKEILSNLKNMRHNEKDAYRNNYDEGAQSFSSKYDNRQPQVPPPSPYGHPPSYYDSRPPPPPYDHRPPPPHYDSRPPPPPYDHRPPPPPYDHRRPPPHYDHRPPPPHYDHRPPPPHYDQRPPPSPYYHEKEPPPYEKGPPQQHRYDYNSWSPQPPSHYDERQIRQSPYYDRSSNRGPSSSPRYDDRPPPSQFHYNDRPPPPPPPFNDGGSYPDYNRPPPPHYHSGGPQYPPARHDNGRPPPPPRHDGGPPPHDRPTSFHDESHQRPPPPRDRLIYDNRPFSQDTPPFDNRPQSNQESVLDTRWEIAMLNRDEIQKKLPSVIENNDFNKNYDTNVTSLIDIRFAEDDDSILSTSKNESTALQNDMDTNSHTQEKNPRFTQLLFQAIPVTPES